MGSWANYRHPEGMNIYISIYINTKRLFRQTEWNFVNITTQEGLAQNNSKPFWRYIKLKRQDDIGTAPLKFTRTLQFPK